MPSFGISHSPAIAWLAISGTSIETVWTSSDFGFDAVSVEVEQHVDAELVVSRCALITSSLPLAQPLEQHADVVCSRRSWRLPHLAVSLGFMNRSEYGLWTASPAP